MWSKDKSKTDLQRFSGKTSLIAAGAELCGDLRFQGAVQVDGRVNGNLLTTDGMVRVSVEGQVLHPNLLEKCLWPLRVADVDGDRHDDKIVAAKRCL